jgi:hypothetical protein
MRVIAQVLSSSLDFSLGKKSASFTNTTSVFILQWERGEGWWRHEILLEAILTPQTNQIYPVCVAGKVFVHLFHSQLQKDQVIHGSIKAFQSTGAFSITFGTFYHRVIWGINCRQPFFEVLPEGVTSSSKA